MQIFFSSSHFHAVRSILSFSENVVHESGPIVIIVVNLSSCPFNEKEKGTKFKGGVVCVGVDMLDRLVCFATTNLNYS